MSLISIMIALGLGGLLMGALSMGLSSLTKTHRIFDYKKDYLGLLDEMDRFFGDLPTCTTFLKDTPLLVNAANVGLAAPKQVVSLSGKTIANTLATNYNYGSVKLSGMSIQLTSNLGTVYTGRLYSDVLDINGQPIVPALKPHSVNLNMQISGGKVVDCSSSVASKGGLKYIVPIGLPSGDTPWTTLTLNPSWGVPNTAHTVFLRFETAVGAGGQKEYRVRQRLGAPDVVLSNAGAAGGGHGYFITSTGLVPLDTGSGTPSFDYQITGTAHGFSVQLIGYMD